MAHLVKRITKDGTHRFDVRTRVGTRNVTRTFIRRQDAEAYLRESERVERPATLTDGGEAWGNDPEGPKKARHDAPPARWPTRPEGAPRSALR